MWKTAKIPTDCVYVDNLATAYAQLINTKKQAPQIFCGTFPHFHRPYYYYFYFFIKSIIS